MDEACARVGGLSLIWANFPAPSKGGGAANRGGCQEVSEAISGVNFLLGYIQVGLWEARVLWGELAPSQVQALEQSVVMVAVLEELPFLLVRGWGSLIVFVTAAPQVEVGAEGELCSLDRPIR